jgi:hypothetical protein
MKWRFAVKDGIEKHEARFVQELEKRAMVSAQCMEGRRNA